MVKLFLFFVAMLFSTSGFAGEIKVGGGGAACSGFITPVGESFEEETGVKVKIAPTNPAQGLLDLKEGRVDVATSIVSFSAMIAEAAKQGVAIDPSLFEVAEIGVNRTRVFTHRTNKVSELSLKQLQGIFTGKIRNWKDIGGDDRAITVIWGALPVRTGCSRAKSWEESMWSVQL